MKIVESKMMVRMLNWVFGGGAILVLLAKIARMWASIEYRAEDSFLFTYFSTWLVDYSSGYVRRGLSGTIIRRLWTMTGVSPHWIILISGIVIFVAVTVIAYYWCRKRRLCWWGIALTVCLGGIEMNNRDGLVLLLCMIAYWVAGNIRANSVRYLLINVLGILVVHTHEMSFFVMMPMLMVLAFFDVRLKFPPLIRLAFLSPIVIAFACVALHKGSVDISDCIIAKWMAELPPWWDGVTLSGIQSDIGIGSSYQFILKQTAGSMFSFWHGVPQFVLFGLEVGVSFLVISRLPFLFYKDLIGEYCVPCLLAIEFITIIAVFPFFVDYSRLFGYWTFSALMCYVLVPRERWSGIFESCANSPFCKILRGGGGIYGVVFPIGL